MNEIYDYNDVVFMEKWSFQTIGICSGGHGFYSTYCFAIWIHDSYLSIYPYPLTHGWPIHGYNHMEMSLYLLRIIPSQFIMFLGIKFYSWVAYLRRQFGVNKGLSTRCKFSLVLLGMFLVKWLCFGLLLTIYLCVCLLCLVSHLAITFIPYPLKCFLLHESKLVWESDFL